MINNTFLAEKSKVVGGESMMADWSNLPEDLVACIAKKIGLLEDFVVFGSVCKTWRRNAPQINFTGDFTQVPILMLPLKDANGECFSLTRRRICKLNLPDVTGKVCLSSMGWLLTVSKGTDPYRLELTLLNPLNHRRIELPSFVGVDSIDKFALSSSPSRSPNYIVMVALAKCSHTNLAFCRSGERNWKRFLTLPYGQPKLLDLTFLKGQFHVMAFYVGAPFVFHIGREDGEEGDGSDLLWHPQFDATPIPLKRRLGGNYESGFHIPLERPVGGNYESNLVYRGSHKFYLVELSGVLLLVICYISGGLATNFKVFEVPSDNDVKQWKPEIKNFGSRSLFLGACSSSFSPQASEYPGCKANCIYFTEDRILDIGISSIGIFNMSDGKVEQQFIKYHGSTMTFMDSA